MSDFEVIQDNELALDALLCLKCEQHISLDSGLLSAINAVANGHKCDEKKLVLLEAQAFAEKAHADQQYGAFPYVAHLRAAVREMQEICSTDLCDLPNDIKTNLLAATWLHDVLEDTETTYGALVDHFGPDIANLVEAVTDPAGPNRYARKVKAYKQIAAFGLEAVAVKLADRIANVKNSVNDPDKHFINMYRAEQASFEEALEDPEDYLTETWDRLRAVFPRPVDEGFYLVVAQNEAQARKWEAQRNTMPGRTIKMYGIQDMHRAYGMSQSYWRIISLKGADQDAVQGLLNRGFKVAEENPYPETP